jgi:hypothetical protein
VSLKRVEDDAWKDFGCVVMIIQWVVVYQSEQNDQRRYQRSCALYLCYANPSVRLGLRLLWALSLLPCSRKDLAVRNNRLPSDFNVEVEI